MLGAPARDRALEPFAADELEIAALALEACEAAWLVARLPRRRETADAAALRVAALIAALRRLLPAAASLAGAAWLGAGVAIE
mmetsp:Transcript_16612/g.47290  ORF Transcript_16612/g.47290 Transcript_16612/m.47290 type:complete len:83 (+) Transcript_16612:566-814(+)